MFILGTICALANGTALPLLTIFFSNFFNGFYAFEYAINTGEDLNIAKEKLDDDIMKNIYSFMILGGSVFIVSYGQMSFWMVAGERQAKRIRQLYYTSILRQEIAFFDSISTGDVTTRISGDTNLYQEGISEKCGLILQHFATFIGGFVIAYTKG